MNTANLVPANPADWTGIALVFLLRFVVIASVMSALSYSFGTDLIESLLPAITAEVEWLDGTYAIDDIRVDHEGADQVVRIRVHQARCLEFNDRTFCGDPRGWATATSLTGSSLLVAVTMLSICLAWPARSATRWRDYLLRGLVLMPLVALIWAVDLPMILWGSVWNLHHSAFASDSFSPLLVWVEFLQGGGRLALAILLSAAVIVLPGIWKRQTTARPSKR